MQVWAVDRFGQRPFAVTNALPVFDNPSGTALIVINSARDHVVVATLGLQAGVPVLVEKPLALNEADVKRLIDLAAVSDVPLAAGHALRFARYLHNFAVALTSAGELAALQVRWEDVRAEARYGEVKSYDSSIPVFVDCLPHVVSMIEALVQVDLISLGKVQIRRGGAEVEIHAHVNDIPVSIVLARNAMQRKRVIEATLRDGSKTTLDFQQEPGFIQSSEGTMAADTLWNLEQRPLATMLTAFLAGVQGTVWDSRLSPMLALRVAKLVDQIQPYYAAQLVNWVCDAVSYPDSSLDKNELDYALRELLQAQNPCLEGDLNKQIQLYLSARSLTHD
jgi:predicted dehydrogenase